MSSNIDELKPGSVTFTVNDVVVTLSVRKLTFKPLISINGKTVEVDLHVDI